MLAPAVTFHDFILGIHILAVILSFGILFTYPMMGLVGARVDDAARPWWARFQHRVHTKVQAPGLVLVLAAGIYLAADGHDFKKFFVQWGIGAVIVIGGIGGALVIPREKRLIELAPAGGAEYEATARQLDLFRYVQLAIVVATVILMALQPS